MPSDIIRYYCSKKVKNFFNHKNHICPWWDFILKDFPDPEYTIFFVFYDRMTTKLVPGTRNNLLLENSL